MNSERVISEAGYGVVHKAAEFIQVYDLARDREYNERLQKSTVEDSEFALRSDHGLFGSAKWWEAVKAGAVPTQTIEGIIAGVYRNQASGWPEFEVKSGNEITSWALEGEPTRYQVGKGVRIDYATVELKRAQATGETSTTIVLSIRIEA